MLNILAWAIVGLIIGAFARLLVPDRQELGLIPTMILGVVGALVGGLFSWLLFGAPGEPFSEYSWPGYLLSILGAFLILLMVSPHRRNA